LNRSNIDFENIVIDDSTVKKLKIKEWPMIIILDKNKIIKFLTFGEHATTNLINILNKN